MLVGARDTAHERNDDADRTHEARKIDTEREEIQIERPIQDGDAKMILKRRERRSNEQEQHAPEDEQVHDAGRLLLHHALLREHFLERAEEAHLLVV